MRHWKRWMAAVLAAAMLLVLLTACGPTGPSVPDDPDNPSSSETGKDPAAPGTGGAAIEDPNKDPNQEKTEEAKKAAAIEALNAVRKEYGLNTALIVDAEASAMAVKMAKLQLDGVNGVYGENQMESQEYKDAWNEISMTSVKNKKLVGVGGYGAYPNAAVYRDWATKTSKWKSALVKDAGTTIVGIGVVKNTDPSTSADWPYMAVVMTY